MDPIDPGPGRQAARLAVPVTARDHRLGEEHAPMVLVQYGDYECPYCAKAHGTVKRLMARAGRSLAFVYRHYPLREIHPNALLAALAAEAAGRQGRFWEMHDVLYEHQSALGPGAIVDWALKIGLDKERFQAALEDGRAQARVRDDLAGGARAGVSGTPAFFVNGYRFTGLPHELQLLRALEETALR